MRYAQVIVLVAIVSICGCASEKDDPQAATPRQSNPKYSAVVLINAAKKNQPGMKCSGEIGGLVTGPAMATATFFCGPEASHTELSREFVEHRDGQDYYVFNWTYTSDGIPTNSKSRLTAGFDGVNETTIIDAEHYIVVCKTPLSPKNGSVAK